MIKTIASTVLLFAALLFSNLSMGQTQNQTDDLILTQYFKQHKIKATKAPSGLYYVITKKGKGDNVKPGQRLSMKYLGTFLDGKQFDGNMDENFELKRAPFSFLLGKGQVIRGWDEGIQNFSVGSQGTLYLPSELAYGPNGNGRIPPNSVLIFQIEVVDAQ